MENIGHNFMDTIIKSLGLLSTALPWTTNRKWRILENIGKCFTQFYGHNYQVVGGVVHSFAIDNKQNMDNMKMKVNVIISIKID